MFLQRFNGMQEMKNYLTKGVFSLRKLPSWTLFLQ